MKKVVVTIALAIGLIFGGAAAAFAHNAYMYQGADWGAVGSDHLNGQVSDRECDGNAVYALLWLKNGNLVTRYDGNGCNNGVKHWTVNSKVNWSFVCEARPPKGDAGDVCGANVTHQN